ncbi:hypothetical protein DFP73DRAFT_600340 [Morchella snyderi]|nr:hypothetical protein DFP73DRAFT_600340 [Morchella snyderi]
MLHNLPWCDVKDEEKRFVVHELNDATAMSSVPRRLLCLEACVRELKTQLLNLDSHVRRSGSSEKTSDAKCLPLPPPPQNYAVERKPSNVEPQCPATATVRQPARPAVDGTIRPPSRPTVTANANASGTKRNLAAPEGGRPPKCLATAPPHPTTARASMSPTFEQPMLPARVTLSPLPPVPSAPMDGGVAPAAPADSTTPDRPTADGPIGPPHGPAVTAEESASGPKRSVSPTIEQPVGPTTPIPSPSALMDGDVALAPPGDYLMLGQLTADGPIGPPHGPAVAAEESASGPKRSVSPTIERPVGPTTPIPSPSALMGGDVALAPLGDYLTLGQLTADGLVGSPPAHPRSAPTTQVSASGAKRGFAGPERDRPPKRQATALELAPPCPASPTTIGQSGLPGASPQSPPVAAPSAPHE